MINKYFSKIEKLKEDINILRDNESSGNVSEPPSLGRSEPKWHAGFRLIFAAFITILGFGAGLYLLLSKETSDDTKKFGTGLIGLVVGHWLS